MTRFWVFDLDNTLIDTDNLIRKHGHMFYKYIKKDNKLKELIHNLEGKKAIFSNGSTYHVLASLYALNIIDEFDFIVDRGWGSVDFFKPDIHTYRRFIHICRIKPSDKVVFFDDRIENLTAAKMFAWNTIWITPEHNFVRHNIQHNFYNYRNNIFM